MGTPSPRQWPRRLALGLLATALVLGVSPLAVAADDTDGLNGVAPPGATDGVPVGSWDDPAEPAGEPPAGESAATTAAVTQRHFGADAFAAIEDSVAATSRTCTISDPDLVALVLAPVFRESSSAATPNDEPAPMTLSRYDEWSGSYPPPETNRNTNYGLYAFEDPFTPFTRAYWHPGIGIWQYDSAGVGAPFTAAERIDTGVISADVATQMARRYCNASGSEQNKRYAAWSPWGNPCSDCQAAFSDLTSTDFASLTLTDDVDATGGMVASTCSINGQSGTFPCHFVDPSQAQGANWWTASASGGSPTSGLTPLSYPFYVVKRNGYEERHWLTKDTGYFADIVAKRRLGTNARPRSNPAGSGLQWSAGPGLCDSSFPATCGDIPSGTLQQTSLTDRGAAVPVTGDFDGDGLDDLFWYAAGGSIDDRWISDGDTSFSTATMTVSGAYEPLVGDYDGDGRDDIFWYAPGPAADYYWWSGDKANSQPTQVNGTYTPLVADFDGNGRAEIFWYAPGSTNDYHWSWNANRQRSQRSQTVNGTYTPLLGDFDGNNRTDVFWYRAGSGADHVFYGRTGGFDYGAVNVSGVYQPLVGDFDDDASDDIIWYRAGTQPDYTWFGDGRTFTSVRNDIFGTYEAFVVDLDPSTASGGDDVIFYGPGSGTDVRWMGRPDRTFETSLDIDISGTWSPLTGQYAGTDRGDIVFWDPSGATDTLWSS
jgi:hypothetical protein